MVNQKEGTKHNSIITFKVGDEEYAADNSEVVTIIPIQAVAQKEGLTFDLIVNLPTGVGRSSVLDMHDCMRVPRKEITEESRLIVVETHNLKYAFLVDKVNELIQTEKEVDEAVELKRVSSRGGVLVYDGILDNSPVKMISFDQIIREDIMKPGSRHQ